MTYNVSNT